jgi:hypothetical protein
LLNHANPASKLSTFIRSHQLAIGLWLMFFGVADLWLVVPNLYGTLGNWHVNFYDWILFMPQWLLLVPVLLFMTLIGTLMLSVYCIRGIKAGKVDDKEHAAVLVTALGFAYLVAGAWPLWTQLYPWPWQEEIANYGNLLVLPLFVGSGIAFFIGAASLYLHSKIYHAALK